MTQIYWRLGLSVQYCSPGKNQNAIDGGDCARGGQGLKVKFAKERTIPASDDLRSSGPKKAMAGGKVNVKLEIS